MRCQVLGLGNPHPWVPANNPNLAQPGECVSCFADGVQPANCTPPCTTPTYPSTCYDVTAFRSRKTRDGEPARLGIFQSDGLEDVALLAVDTSDELALGGRGKGHLVLAFRATIAFDAAGNPGPFGSQWGSNSKCYGGKLFADLQAAGNGVPGEVCTSWVTPIDHMITNFGDQNTGRLLEAITAKYREVLRVNVNARIYVTGHSRGGALVSRQQLWLNVDADN
eukprot:jgi/Chrzof1/7222/Cz02g15090.t1